MMMIESGKKMFLSYLVHLTSTNEGKISFFFFPLQLRSSFQNENAVDFYFFWSVRHQVYIKYMSVCAID